mmetsp:Transcript_53426/g.99489  ORF Transcript_53426/g.99489 Transcript_53426/m.99489 type:complete len:390 (-) Transcript_53426:38-1207(-)
MRATASKKGEVAPSSSSSPPPPVPECAFLPFLPFVLTLIEGKLGNIDAPVGDCACDDDDENENDARGCTFCWRGRTFVRPMSPESPLDLDLTALSPPPRPSSYSSSSYPLPPLFKWPWSPSSPPCLSCCNQAPKCLWSMYGADLWKSKPAASPRAQRKPRQHPLRPTPRPTDKRAATAPSSSPPPPPLPPPPSPNASSSPKAASAERAGKWKTRCAQLEPLGVSASPSSAPSSPHPRATTTTPSAASALAPAPAASVVSPTLEHSRDSVRAPRWELLVKDDNAAGSAGSVEAATAAATLAAAATLVFGFARNSDRTLLSKFPCVREESWVAPDITATTPFLTLLATKLAPQCPERSVGRPPNSVTSCEVPAGLLLGFEVAESASPKATR